MQESLLEEEKNQQSESAPNPNQDEKIEQDEKEELK
jgi:hypothetical protein